MSVWYGTSKSGVNGSPYFVTSTFSESSLPIGTLGSMIFGIVIMIFVTFSSNSFSKTESSSNLFAPAAT